MVKNFKKLEIFDGESLMDERIEPLQFCIDTLLPQGLIILAGPPKVGKSWLVLDWCLSISKGEKVWNYTTKQGTTLCICLEDNKRRLQKRLNVITDDVPGNIFFATSSCSLAEGLEEQMVLKNLLVKLYRL